MPAVTTQTLADWGWGHHAWWAGAWVAIVAVVAAVRWPSPGASRPSDDGRRADAILEGRLARGEIDTAEFRERRSALEGRS